MRLSLLVVVPTFDSFLLLPSLVDSLCKQEWPHWRVVFIDGPSCSAHRDWLDRCCSLDSRFSWVEQSPSSPGIFGAMNQGFSLANDDDWILFWGSDDWAASPRIFTEIIDSIDISSSQPDLVVCQGRYANADTRILGRLTCFHSPGFLDSISYRRTLFFGSTPPHQATLFGPGAHLKLSSYSPGFSLSADLDYFLRLSRHSDLLVQCLDLDLVHMADGGVSSQQTLRRLREVRTAYSRAFGWIWWFPFFARYIRRVLSLVSS